MGTLRVLDVATGGADLPREVARVLRGRGVRAIILAIDFNPITLACARERSRAVPELRFARGDARRLPLRTASVDVVLGSLVLHHFGEEEAVVVLREMARVARRALIINDLRRSPTALLLIWLITRFCRNRMTRYDGPLSVRRAFTPAELRRLAAAAGLDGARVMRQPFYRQALVYERPPCS
jgi:ubiquinone/menaquinone biosynthesis C-methylase UbiE